MYADAVLAVILQVESNPTAVQGDWFDLDCCTERMFASIFSVCVWYTSNSLFPIGGCKTI